MLHSLLSKQALALQGHQRPPPARPTAALPADIVLRKSADCACGGGCPSCRQKDSPPSGFKISEPGDALEREADQIADQVMRMPARELLISGTTSSSSSKQGAREEGKLRTLTSKRVETAGAGPQKAPRLAEEMTRMTDPACANAPTYSASSKAPKLRRVCEECETEHDNRNQLQTKADAALTNQAPGIVEEVLRSPGQLLDAATREFFEPRLGHDFGDVRVHADAKAAESARAVNALAYTVGRDVVFGAGQYAPNTNKGRKLLAHELTHVVQEGTTIQVAQVLDYSKKMHERQTSLPELIIGKRPVKQSNKSKSTSLLTRCRSNQVTGGARVLRRRVRDSNVSCRTTGLHGGVPGGDISGPDAIAQIRVVDASANAMANDAVSRLHDQLNNVDRSGYVADPVLDAALASRFGLSLTNHAHRGSITILERELRAVVRLLDRGLFFVCRDPGCDPGDWAFVLSGDEHTIRLCNPFWNGGDTPNFQASTILHEAIHLWWDQVDDQGHPPLHNAHCFEQFALDLAGATSEIPAEFTSACMGRPP